MAAVESPYDSTRDADDAYWAWVDQSEDGGGEGGAEESDGFTGSLSMPPNLEVGQSFDATASVENTTSEALSGRFVLVWFEGDSPQVISGPIEQRVAGDDSVELTFQVDRGMLQAEGETTFHVYSTNDAPGSVATDTRTIGSGGSGTQESEWGESEYVQELRYGWHLYLQEHLEEDKVRYIVAGKNGDGQVIFLNDRGKTQEDPHYFSSTEDVRAALEMYRENEEAGNPGSGGAADPAASRPSTEAIDKATGDADDAAARKKKFLAAAILVVAVGGYVYMRRQGTDPLAGVWEAAEPVTDPVEDFIGRYT